MEILVECARTELIIQRSFQPQQPNLNVAHRLGMSGRRLTLTSCPSHHLIPTITRREHLKPNRQTRLIMYLKAAVSQSGDHGLLRCLAVLPDSLAHCD
jgi:hypothetical protein